MLQDIFLKVFTHINDYNSELKFSAWIFRIAHNQMVSKIRFHSVRSQTEHVEDFDEIPTHFLASDSTIERKELAQKIREIQNEMPDKLKDVFVLRFWENKDYSEMGDILRLNENTVATHLRRAREFFIERATDLGLKLYFEGT